MNHLESNHPKGNKSLGERCLSWLLTALVILTVLVPQSIFAMGSSEASLGELALFPYTYAPQGWLLADGRELQISQHEVLYAVIGNAYGGDGISTFALPNLSKRNEQPGVDVTASPVEDVRYYICVEGTFGNSAERQMAELILYPVQYERSEHARHLIRATGQQMPIVQNQALYSILGTRFGGNGTSTFALPNLKNMSPVEGYEYYIVANGIYPSSDYYGGEAYIGSIGLFITNYIQENLPELKGQTLSIQQNSALYSLLGITFGGDGRTTFQLPDMQMAAPHKFITYRMETTGTYPMRP